MNAFRHSAALLGIVAASLSAGSAQAAPLYSNDFETDTTSFWNVNRSTGANANNAGSFANFFFDYSTVGIPSAPNSIAGSTRGLQLRANVTGSIVSGISASPTGQSFSGDYTLRFDMWLNFNGPLAAGGSGSTQLTGAGIGTAGTSAQWAGGAHDATWFAATGDGGASVDYRAYSPAAPAGLNGYPEGPVFAATGTATRNSNNPYYSVFGGASAPAAQLSAFPEQTGATSAGAQGFAWREVEVSKQGNNVTYSIDGLRIATVDVSSISLGGGNIVFSQSDPFSGSSTDANSSLLLFGLIDNVSVVPEPGTFALGALALAAFFVARRKR